MSDPFCAKHPQGRFPAKGVGHFFSRSLADLGPDVPTTLGGAEPVLKYPWDKTDELVYEFDINAELGARKLAYHDRNIVRPSGKTLERLPQDRASGQTTGSGFIVHPQGIVVTCADAVKGANKIEARIGDDTWDATVIKLDFEHDLAILRLDQSGMPYLKFADSDQVRLGQVLVWQFDAKGTLKPKDQFSIRQGEVKSIAITPDNQHVISLHASGVACLWDLESGEVLGRFKDFRFSSRGAVRFSKQGGHAMISDGLIAATIDVSEQKVVQWMALPRASGQFVSISPDGRTIAAGETYDIAYANTQTGQPTVTSDGKEIAWSADISPDGKRIITGGREQVLLWNIKTGLLLKKFSMGNSGYVKHVAFSPDGIHSAAIGAPIGQLVEIFRLPDEFQAK